LWRTVSLISPKSLVEEAALRLLLGRFANSSTRSLDVPYEGLACGEFSSQGQALRIGKSYWISSKPAGC
ncbi:MAG: hypothetical protein ACK5GJ_00135, partial [Planctomycetota bacterium]